MVFSVLSNEKMKTPKLPHSRARSTTNRRLPTTAAAAPAGSFPASLVKLQSAATLRRACTLAHRRPCGSLSVGNTFRASAIKNGSSVMAIWMYPPQTPLLW